MRFRIHVPRKLLAVTVIIAAAAVFDSTSTRAEDPDIVTISGASPQGRMFQKAALFAKILDREIGGTSFNGVAGKGVSIGNLKRINAGNVEAGFIYFQHLDEALRHAGAFEGDDTNYENVQAWINVTENFIRIIGKADIETPANLKGRRISIGARGSGDDAHCLTVLGAEGITEDNADFVYMTRGDASEALINGQIDAMCSSYSRNNQSHLGALFSALKIGEDVDFIEPSEAAMEKLVSEHDYFFVDRKGEPVFGRPELSGIAYAMGGSVSSNLSEDLVYEMTKALFENWDEVRREAPWLEEHPGPEKGANINFVPYHPGAINFYREIGVWEDAQR